MWANEIELKRTQAKAKATALYCDRNTAVPKKHKLIQITRN